MSTTETGLDLNAIRERHSALAPSLQGWAHRDRGALLAEIERLRGQVARVADWRAIQGAGWPKAMLEDTADLPKADVREAADRIGDRIGDRIEARAALAEPVEQEAGRG